jgi:hypothetical protein
MAAMVAFFLVVGIAGALVSLFALGYGFAYNGFEFGNTLIIAGVVGLGASLGLVGIGSILRQLRRLADALSARGAGRVAAVPEPAEAPAAAPAPGARIPYPPKPETPMRDPRPAEPRMAEPHELPVAERPRNVFAAGREPPPVTEPDYAPLAPARVPAPATVAPAGSAETPYEPKFGPADILARLGGGRAPRPEPHRDAGHEPDQPSPRRLAAESAPAEPEPARRSRNMFESVWPTQPHAAEAEAPRAPRPEPRPETVPEAAPESRPERRFEPKYELKRPRAEPPVLQSAVAAPPPPPAAAPAPSAPPPPPPPAEPKAASILKSGVIDGMAYTLYTDGSIEAQLPQGTMHFASIEELRLHLERNG